MNERAGVPTAPGMARTAGGILREARQAQGMHIAALAASIKVAQKKLEALEADRFDELPDATFARALAQTVCRSLKIESAPVLALLPQQQFTSRLEHVSEGINEPFRDRPGGREPVSWAVLRSPAVWVPLLLVLGMLALYLAPQGWLARFQSSSAAGAAPSPASVSTLILSPSASDPGVAASGAALPLAAPADSPVPVDPGASAAGPLHLRAKSDTWVEVADARSQLLIGRLLHAGETVQLDGELPLRVKVGNAAGTELSFRGQSVDLLSLTRDNVARLELK